jgi:hypothetical protein
MWRWVVATFMLLVGCATPSLVGRWEFGAPAGTYAEPDYKMAEAACIERHGVGPPASDPLVFVVAGMMDEPTPEAKAWAERIKACMYRQGWVFVEEPQSKAPHLKKPAASQIAYVENVQKSFRAMEEERLQRFPETNSSHCSFPQLSNNELTVLRVSEYAERQGLMPGDKILAVDGVPVYSLPDFARAVLKHRLDEPARITIGRGNVEQTLDVRCIDGLPAAMNLSAVLVAGTEGRWDDCIFQIGRFEQETFQSSLSATLKMSCNEARRRSKGQAAEYVDAFVIYEATRLGLEETKIHPEGTPSKRAFTIGNISWLESNGYQSLADDLKTQLSRIDSEDH